MTTLLWKLIQRTHNALLMLLLLATLPVVSASASSPATVEHIPGLDNFVSDPALSDDGQWMVWADRNGATPKMYLQDLVTGIQTVRELRSTTGDTDLDFPNSVYPSINTDGSRIAMIADGPDGSRRYEVLLVVNASGEEFVRVTGANDGSLSFFEESIYIDSSGNYVAFTSDAARFTSTINGKKTYFNVNNYDGYENAFRLHVPSGEIVLVSEAANATSTDYSFAQGIATNGQYVLYTSDASHLPGSNGEEQAYRRTMSGGAVEHISVDETGNTLSELECSSNCSSLDISNDGSRVVFTERYNDDHSFLWEEGVGTIVLNDVGYPSSDKGISGDGRWLVSEDDSFSRLKLDDLTTETIIETMEEPRINGNGTVVMFFNDSLTSDPGRWWLLRNEVEADLNPINLTVNEIIGVQDDSEPELAAVIKVNEIIGVLDNSEPELAAVIQVHETIGVNDASLKKSIPPLLSAPELTLPGPLAPNVPFIVRGDGFMPHTLVEVFLYSTPVKVGEQYADPVGNVRLEITIPEGFPPGPHLVVLKGIGFDGTPREISENITTNLTDIIFKDGFDWD